jgi:hypothetical protein
MEVAKPDLGKTLTTVLDIHREDGKVLLPVKDLLKFVHEAIADWLLRCPLDFPNSKQHETPNH